MKPTVIISVIGAALLLGACQSTPPANNFAEKTHRTYNPETGSFEQSPPYGKQSNKADSQ